MFNEKQYRGKHSKYPKVYSDINDQDKLAIISVAWGDNDANNLVASTIRDYYLSAKNDREQTSPFPLDNSISKPANHLKIALQLANNSLYKEWNNEEYMSLVEIMAVAIHERELIVAYIGGPSLLCKKRNKDLILYAQNHHLAREFGATKNYPLPTNFIGDQIKKEVQLKTFRISDKDKFYFLLCDQVPLIQNSDTLEIIEKKLKLESERPYWLAEWTI